MKKQKTWYAVGEIVISHKCQVGGNPILSDLPMVWADGMEGAMPVFSNKRKAQKYAGKRELIEIYLESEK